MLRKLIKHELKATSRLLVPLYIALLCLSGINHFMFNLKVEEGILALITRLLFMVQSLSTIAIVIATAIFMIVRFYKNFLTDEGYLMFTLPTKTHQLILSKLVVTLFWIIISAICAAVSWFIVVSSLNDINLINLIKEVMTYITGELNFMFKIGWAGAFIQLLIIGILFLVGNILLVYASIAIGQLFKKYKIVASIVSYVVINNVSQAIVIGGITGSGYILTENSTLINTTPTVILSIIIIIGLIGCSIFYAATNYIFNRKLNLE